MFYDSPLLPGLLLVALISLPYEVSTKSSCPCNYFCPSHLSFHPFIGPPSSKLMSPSNVKSRVISHLAGKTNESGLMWPLVPWLNICTCSSLTAHNRFRPVKKTIFTVPMVSIVLRWSLVASVFSSHASGSPWDPWESANPPCKFAMCGLQWDQRAPLFFFFFILFSLFFKILFYDTGFPEPPAW